MPGILMSEYDDQLRPDSALVERLLARSSEMQHVGALARLAPEALAKQVGYIRLIVDDEDADCHVLALADGAWPPRGRRTVNSVNSLTRLSTAIVPLCCCTTIS